ncbi:MAG TPA: hemolysin family protein [Chitinophagaceae bacterium]|nr:hemolysin family protein [Chitinophagaceae bacterium]HND94861.1 hemolysin family protein [Chitinophagaceae bacterium]HNF38682.1 hemolysin family protein [Chitinophagaceae bacterium]HNF45386.1 hemolysin family protein [Chitinophagaceae bacterium]HNJ25420.1 hemolysin family protein [Chitinophagaceae bacterium]
MIEWESIVLFILTLLLMAFFSGIEMAYYSANRLSLELKKKQGNTTSGIITRFIESPDRFLGTTLIGYIIFLTFLGLQLSHVMHPIWSYLHIQSELLHSLFEIGFTTGVVLLFAEFIPRAYFRAHSNKWLASLARVTDFFYQLFSPVAISLIKLSEWILKYFFGVRMGKDKEAFERSDLKHLFQPQPDDERQERNAQLLENAQELPKIRIRQCLVPRKEIIGIDSTASMDEVRKKFEETRLSKLVVYNQTIDNITGYMHQLDLFKNPASIASILITIPAVPESMTATDLIGKLSRERKSIAWVVDEFGGTAGIVTLEDVLEELFGEIQDEYDTEEFVEKQLAENEFIFSGRIELDYLENKYDFDFADDESETLSGYIINYHETIPRQKERIIIENYEFDIVNVSDTRIEMVKMKKLK